MEIRSHLFAAEARKALSNEQLQRALALATDRLSEQRNAAFAQFPEGEALRDRARQIKLRTLASLDRYLEQFATELESRGGIVHFAADAHEARKIIVGLVRERDGRVAVKSKSMTTEEIDLNRSLLRAGIQPVETDLGSTSSRFPEIGLPTSLRPRSTKPGRRSPTCSSASTDCRVGSGTRS